MKVRVAGIAAALIFVVSACSPPKGQEVATFSNVGTSVGNYLNAATAAYAECLQGVGIGVTAIDEAAGPPGFVGYAEIDGSMWLTNGMAVETEDALAAAPIGVDGTDRTEDVRDCYEANPGAKDTMLDSLDDPGVAEDGIGGYEGIAPEEIEASIDWVECARDAGVTVIDDPAPDGYITIPQELELAEARMLGDECSAPMIEEDYWPLFLFNAGVEDENGMFLLDPYIEAIDGRFLEVLCENNPDEC